MALSGRRFCPHGALQWVSGLSSRELCPFWTVGKSGQFLAPASLGSKLGHFCQPQKKLCQHWVRSFGLTGYIGVKINHASFCSRILYSSFCSRILYWDSILEFGSGYKTIFLQWCISALSQEVPWSSASEYNHPGYSCSLINRKHL